MIRRVSGSRKCAITLFFLFFQSFYGFCNFSDHHLGNIARCRTENRDHGNRIEIVNVGEIIPCEVEARLITCSHQRHIRDAASQSVFQPDFQIEIVQFLQKAVTFDRLEIGKVI